MLYFIAYEYNSWQAHPYKTLYEKKVHNDVIDIHPLKWLIKYGSLEPDEHGIVSHYRLLFWAEISNFEIRNMDMKLEDFDFLR